MGLLLQAAEPFFGEGADKAADGLVTPAELGLDLPGGEPFGTLEQTLGAAHHERLGGAQPGLQGGAFRGGERPHEQRGSHTPILACQAVSFQPLLSGFALDPSFAPESFPARSYES